MPDSTITADTSGAGDDGVALNTSTADWATTRGSATTTGSNHMDFGSAHPAGVLNRKYTGRGTRWNCYRSYFSFDVSGESGTVESATIKIYLQHNGSSTTMSRVVLVEATTLAGSAADFGNVFSSGTTLGTLIHDDYVGISNVAGFHDFELNSDGISALNDKIGTGKLQVGLMGHYSDYLGNDPASAYTTIAVDYTEGTNDPIIEIDYASATVTYNATFFGSNF
tara:strand:- start:77 stop:748 length:672 start_codon:yes stop_codon:yes gene_type:complete